MYRLIFVALFAAAAVSAQAASFDCKRAGTPREHAVCQDSDLSKSDDQLAALYKTVRGKLSAAAFASVQADQGKWLRWIDQVCNPKAFADPKDYPKCLGNMYGDRIGQLDGVQTIGGMTFYPVSRYVYAVQGKPSPNENGYDENAYSGAFTWPQIDQPTPAQQAWNRQVQAQVLEAARENDDQHTLDQVLRDAAANTIGTQESFSCTIQAANQRLIVTTIDQSSYGGGAHGSDVQTRFLWWLDQGRLLTAEDVFRSDSDWQHKLVTPAIKKILASWGDNYDGDGDLDEGDIGAGIADTGHWTLDATGLTVTYGQYEIAAYAFGMPQADFTWSELAPWLNPAFHPETLPPPNPQAQ